MDKNDSDINDNNERKKRKDNVLDWREYMSSKKEKLLKQLNEKCDEINENNENNDLNQLFSGVCVHINGVINPSEIELKQLIISSGGMYLNHFDAKRTTHTIAQNLPHSKIKNLKANQIVVNPEWITHSIEAKQLLPVEDYLIIKRDPNLRLYFKKSTEISGEDVNQLFNPNETTDDVINDPKEIMTNEDCVEPQLTTVCEKVFGDDNQSKVHFNRSHYIPDSLSQIDPQFLEALPLSLRNDILKDIDIHSNLIKSEVLDKNPKKVINKTKNSNKKTIKLSENEFFEDIRCDATNCVNSGRNQNMFEKPDEQTFGGLLTSVMSANICGKTNTEEIMQLIEEWVNTEEELIDEDIAYVTKYFCDLIDERKYKNLIKTVSKLFDCIEKRDEIVWKQSFNEIRNTIITEIKANNSNGGEDINNLPVFPNENLF